MANTRGRFIVFEGLDGSGTSTQCARLRDALAARGIAVEVTREPTSGPVGGVIRQAIEGRVVLDDTALALAFAADRADHLFNAANGVLASLDAGRWVISDRYVLSSLAYQGAGRDRAAMDWLAALNRAALPPDATVFVETSPRTCAGRIAQRSAHPELFHDEAKLERIAEAFGRALAYVEFTGRLVVVNGEADPDAVFRSVLAGLGDLVEGASPP